MSSFNGLESKTAEVSAKGSLLGDDVKVPKERKNCEDFDEILDLIGSQGRYQKILLYGIICPFVAISPFLYMTKIFMLDIPNHWCHVPGRNESVSMDEWKTLTLPWEIGPSGRPGISQCNMYDPDTRNIIPCQFGWDYDRSDYSETIPSEYNWVCKKSHYATEIFSTGSFGGAFGVVIFAFAADKFGRKPVYFVSLFLSAVGKALMMIFTAYDLTVFKITNILAGIPLWALLSMPMLMTAEVCGAYYRAWLYTMTWIVWVIGNCLVPFVAMFIRHWYYLGISSVIPGTLCLLYYPFVDESPRWQISVGKIPQATKTIRKVAKRNGTYEHQNWEEIDRMIADLHNKQLKEAKDTKLHVLSLFSTSSLAKIFILLAITRTVVSLLYHGINLNTLRMAGNKFVNYFLMSLVEGPGAWLGGKLMDITGRRWTQTGFMIFSAFVCVCSAIAVTFSTSAVFSLLGTLLIKLGMTVASLVAYLQGTELLPTKLRSTGNGLCTLVSRMLGSLGPYIVFAGTFHVSFPYLLLGLCCLIGSVAAAFLPETFKQHLPETVEDADKFGKGHKFWSFLPQIHEEKNKENINLNKMS